MTDHGMLLIWILSIFCVVINQSAFIRKENSHIVNRTPVNDVDNIDNFELQLQDSPRLKDSKEYVEEEGQNLESAFIIKENSHIVNRTPVNDVDNIDNFELQLQDSPRLKDSKEYVEEEGQNLEDSLKIMYQQSAWEQLVATVDVWEVTGALSSKLGAVSPSEVENEDASNLLDYILSTVKPFLNNSRVVADAGTALNMHNCSVDGIVESLQRDGPAILSVDDDIATLIFSITTNTLKMKCNWYQWVMIKYYGVVSATLSSITVETVVDMKLQPDQHPIVRKTTVKELGEIKSDITGVGPLGMLVRTIINKMIQQYRVMIIDAIEQQAPIAMQASLNNITTPNYKNITSAFNNEIKYQENINHIENNTNESDNIKITEKFLDDFDEYSGIEDGEIETQVENTNSDRTKEENDLLLLNEYGNKIHPKLIQVPNTSTNTNNYKNEEEMDLILLNDYENNIHPKFKKV